MDDKSWAYKFGYICGAIAIGVATVGLSTLLIASVVYIIGTIF